MNDQELRLSVIVPARNCASMLSKTLQALMDGDLSAVDWEMIVVDDDSDDHTGLVASQYAANVVSLTHGPHGPAYARNRGAEIARGRYLAFVDADVLIHPDALRRMADQLDATPELGAIFGAYDTSPPAPGLVSQYRNLVHHWVHLNSAGDIHTFWAGCGTVRRSAFQQVGGFDAVRFRRPQIEDIELGHRLREAGWQIRLDPTLQGTHLKSWTFLGGLVTDIRDRGVPWALLMMSQKGARSSALNLGLSERLATATVVLAVLGTFASIWDSRFLVVSVVLVVIALIPSLPLFRWLNSLRGPIFTARAVPLRMVYYLASAVSVIIAAWKTLRVGPPEPRRPTINEVQT